jgi:hypothetical protein
MSAILLETGSKLDFSAHAIVVGCPRTSPAFLLAPPLHGFTHLGSIPNHKEWRFFGD